MNKIAPHIVTFASLWFSYAVSHAQQKNTTTAFLDNISSETSRAIIELLNEVSIQTINLDAFPTDTINIKKRNLLRNPATTGINRLSPRLNKNIEIKFLWFMNTSRSAGTLTPSKQP